MTTTGRMLLDLEPYLQALADAGNDVDEVIFRTLNEEKYAVSNMMWKYLRESSETWTGAAGRTLYFEGPMMDGNFTFIEVGAHTDQDPAALYKEYGTPQQAAEPFLRPTLQYYRSRGMKTWLKAVLERYGLAA